VVDEVDESVADRDCGVGNDGCTTSRCAIDLRSDAKVSPMNSPSRRSSSSRAGLTRIQGTDSSTVNLKYNQVKTITISILCTRNIALTTSKQSTYAMSNY